MTEKPSVLPILSIPLILYSSPYSASIFSLFYIIHLPYSFYSSTSYIILHHYFILFFLYFSCSASFLFLFFPHICPIPSILYHSFSYSVSLSSYSAAFSSYSVSFFYLLFLYSVPFLLLYFIFLLFCIIPIPIPILPSYSVLF